MVGMSVIESTFHYEAEHYTHSVFRKSVHRHGSEAGKDVTHSVGARSVTVLAGCATQREHLAITSFPNHKYGDFLFQSSCAGGKYAARLLVFAPASNGIHSPALSSPSVLLQGCRGMRLAWRHCGTTTPLRRRWLAAAAAAPGVVAEQQAAGHRQQPARIREHDVSD